MENRAMDTSFKIADREFASRLIVGTGKYSDNPTMVDAIRATGAEMVTVAVRRIDLDRTKEEGILYHLDPDEYLLLPNTAGCFSADDAVVGELMECPDCGTELEVLGTDPAELGEAPESEEDWGE